MLAAGKKDDVARCLPLLQCIGRGVTRVGEAPAQANIVKLAGNFMIASMLETLGEAFALTRKAGVAPQLFLEIFSSVFGKGSAIFENYAKTVANEAYAPPGMKIPLGLKDVRLALDAGHTLGVPLPFAEILREHFQAAVAEGKADLDWSAIARLAAERAGL